MCDGFFGHPGLARMPDVAHAIEAFSAVGTAHEPTCAVHGAGWVCHVKL
jgi:hypothetical protein